MKLLVFYISWLYVPATALVLWALFTKRIKGRGQALFAAMFLAGTTILAYARFVEPRILLTNTHEIELCRADTARVDVKVAVFSDTHYGTFKNAMPLSRIAKRVNTEQPDFVLLPGDFTHYPQKDKIPEILSGLSEIDAPIYAVMGNHDEGLPGPDLTPEVEGALQKIGVTLLDPAESIYTDGLKQVKIIGFMDHWAVSKKGAVQGAMNEDNFDGPVIYLQHNPDMLEEVPTLGQFDLMVAGHTHGGQINLPLITCSVTFACDVLRYGYAKLPQGNLFVTSGTGMVGLPMRFNVPPVIDILNINFGPCGSADLKE